VRQVAAKDGAAMPGRDVVVVGASAGGVEAMVQLVAGLPADFPGSLFFVLHLPAEAPSALPAILSRHGPLPATHAVDGEPIRPGRIYVALPNHHLIVDRDAVRLGLGPRENRHRPSVDVLFRSAARAYGPRAVGVVLSGTLDDGTAGLVAIKRLGGIAIVQDPVDALLPGMPESALAHADVDYTASAAEIPELLERLATEPLPKRGAPNVSEELANETEIADLDPEALGSERAGEPARFGCPDCGGTLWEVDESGLLRFRCRVGHAYSADSLLSAEAERLEDALWAALRTLRETSELSRRLAKRSEEQGQHSLVTRFAERADEAEQRAEVIRQVLGDGLAGARPS
jgi:two-component system chemotaxis response regulator CheB